jgi:biotin carboxylase
VPVARGQVARHPDQVRTFIAEVGLPVVAKPDIGVGANRTYKITTPTELEEFLAGPFHDYFVEEFVYGTIQTFDGLADRQGEPVFFTSMQYSRGVMEVVNEDDDIYYFTQRDVPADLEEAGRNILKIFGVRERFFHFEFFRKPTGELVALEVNMRPPGGLSLDMFNYASDIDLYAEWALMLRDGRISRAYSRPYHICYVGRKWYHHYQLSHAEVLERYGTRIIHHQPMAQVFHRAMGSYGYLLRTTELDEAVGIAEEIQQRAR